ncbi:MAG: type II toxin-antitoxin system RelE/ParE family toxin [Rhodocyclaceae bacterium]|nr:type II toxin-antitoxin system RelE/ParE family toxin [Rhodocyclaceae bacterium]
MAWSVIYHPEVAEDLTLLGSAEARRTLAVIEERILHGEPDKAGKPLRGILAGSRRIRTGNIRIVYRVDGKRVEVLIIAVGARRDDEVYQAAESRTPRK